VFWAWIAKLNAIHRARAATLILFRIIEDFRFSSTAYRNRLPLPRILLPQGAILYG
jgi:hypothetical protein